jgi:hypothetical protein
MKPEDVYPQVLDDARHYSAIRVSLGLFFWSAAGLLVTYQPTFTLVPFVLSLVALYVGYYWFTVFGRMTQACWEYAKELEKPPKPHNGDKPTGEAQPEDKGRTGEPAEADSLRSWVKRGNFHGGFPQYWTTAVKAEDQFQKQPGSTYRAVSIVFGFCLVVKLFFDECTDVLSSFIFL